MPKLNMNLLSVISLIVLCAMMFLTFTSVALACCCDDKQAAAEAALEAAEAALEDFNKAEEVLQYVLEQRPINWDLVNAAMEAHKTAKEALDNAMEALSDATKALVECRQNCNCNSGSGGCDSGGCDSGGCG
jgi:tetratricopeptide (TPR) repeat protein